MLQICYEAFLTHCKNSRGRVEMDDNTISYGTSFTLMHISTSLKGKNKSSDMNIRFLNILNISLI